MWMKKKSRDWAWEKTAQMNCLPGAQGPKKCQSVFLAPPNTGMLGPKQIVPFFPFLQRRRNRGFQRPVPSEKKWSQEDRQPRIFLTPKSFPIEQSPVSQKNSKGNQRNEEGLDFICGANKYRIQKAVDVNMKRKVSIRQNSIEQVW